MTVVAGEPIVSFGSRLGNNQLEKLGGKVDVQGVSSFLVARCVLWVWVCVCVRFFWLERRRCGEEHIILQGREQTVVHRHLSLGAVPDAN